MYSQLYRSLKTGDYKSFIALCDQSSDLSGYIEGGVPVLHFVCDTYVVISSAQYFDLSHKTAVFNVLEYLIDVRGLDVNEVNMHSKLPVFSSLLMRDTALLRYLIIKGADVNKSVITSTGKHEDAIRCWAKSTYFFVDTGMVLIMNGADYESIRADPAYQKAVSVFDPHYERYILQTALNKRRGYDDESSYVSDLSNDNCLSL